mmetsp:Transcript_38595/g.80883  ORF Transcript_38595/g.80883 Transcript_38595/m.80883 type:complete len:593 (+) Transcript_38595:216-1994(+)
MMDKDNAVATMLQEHEEIMERELSNIQDQFDAEKEDHHDEEDVNSQMSNDVVVVQQEVTPLDTSDTEREDAEQFKDFLHILKTPSEEKHVPIAEPQAQETIATKSGSDETMHKMEGGGQHSTAIATDHTKNTPSLRVSKSSSIFSARDGHTLEFDNVLLSTKTKNAEKNPPKTILNGLSGSFPPKTLTAVMGPSGSGKTSLLKILTGRMGGSSNLDYTGTIRLDNEVVDPANIAFRKKIAYVEQDVTIPSTCTPREAIAFSARLRLDAKLTDAEIANVVNDILDNLGLQHVADTLIGGGILMAGGLSGGEKKRVQCGVELVTNPSLLVLDEPTSGLDSYSAQSLVEVLGRIAQAGATVIVTIHQPPPPVVRKIDNLMLLLSGRLLYEGPMGLPVEEAFEEKKFPKPDDYNIADWILQVAQTNSIEDFEEMGFFDDEKKNQNKSKKAPVVARAESSVAASPKDHVGFAVQTRLLFDREVKNLVRDKFATIIRIVSNTSFGLLFGLIFLGVGKSDYVEYPEVMASFGAIANLLISTMFGVAQSSLMEFPKDRPVFLREYSTNHYSVLPYFLAKFSLECVTVMTQVPILIRCHMV